MNRYAGIILLIVLSSSFDACIDSASADSCSAGAIAQRISSLPAGGTVDFSACGSMSLAGPINLGTPTAPVTLLLGTGTVTLTNTAGNGFVLGGSGSRLIGQGANNTVIAPVAGFSGDIIHIEPTGGNPYLNGIEVAELSIDQTNAPAVTALNLLSVRDPSSFHNLALTRMTGTAIQITSSSISQAKLPQGIGLRDIYVTAYGTLTADTVIVTGNQIYLGANVKIINFGSSGAFRGLVIRPSGDAHDGDGRYNSFFSGAVAGYGTCLSVETPDPVSATGAIGNIIGPGNTFENCDLGYEMTGVDAAHRAVNNWAFGNAFLSTVPKIARLDFANDNFVEETANGTIGTIALTSNSTNNTVFARLANAGGVSDTGSKNLVFSLLSTTGFSLNGDLHVGGTLYKAAGSFRIDDPLDPKNKYLQHSFVESPDMMNIYNGVVTLKESGSAEVRLPDYFEALNRDFRYQLTPIGSYAPVYVEQEIEHNTFRIAGGKPGQRISWQVTGIRHDAYANEHRIQVETSKSSR
jgi:hypothetical protein